jgi:hypothetical protein
MCIEGKDVPALIAAHRMSNSFTAETHRTCMDELVVNKEGIYLHAGDWKWYDSHEDVQWFEALWGEAAEMEADGSELHGLFYRIGEDNNDVEERAFGSPDWEAVRLVRQLDVNFPEQETIEE